MQNAILALIVGASLMCVTALAMTSRRRRGHDVGLQVALGVVTGIVAAGAILVLRTDLVPDDVEFVFATILVVIVASLLVFTQLRRAP